MFCLLFSKTRYIGSTQIAANNTPLSRNLFSILPMGILWQLRLNRIYAAMRVSGISIILFASRFLVEIYGYFNIYLNSLNSFHWDSVRDKSGFAISTITFFNFKIRYTITIVLPHMVSWSTIQWLNNYIHNFIRYNKYNKKYEILYLKSETNIVI